MKRLLVLFVAAMFAAACAPVQEAKNFANCKYAISGVEITDYNVNSLGFDVYLAITNLSRKTAASIKKFEGKLTMNDVPVADVLLENIRIEAGTTKTQKVHLDVPMSSFSTKMIGLVSMGSASVDYHIVGTAYFDTPMGEVPVPVDIGRRGSNN